MKQSWLQSGTVYGYRKVTDDLCEQGKAAASIEWREAQLGYERRDRAMTMACRRLWRQIIWTGTSRQEAQ